MKGIGLGQRHAPSLSNRRHRLPQCSGRSGGVGPRHPPTGTWSGRVWVPRNRDGKGMASMNHAPRKKCWCSDDASSLQPTNAVAATPRWGALVRCVPPSRRVADHAHALAHICSAVRKRLGANVSEWAGDGQGRGCGGRLKEVWACFTQEVARVPVSECIAMWPLKGGQLDIISSRFFLMNPIWQQRVVDLISMPIYNGFQPTSVQQWASH